MSPNQIWSRVPLVHSLLFFVLYESHESRTHLQKKNVDELQEILSLTWIFINDFIHELICLSGDNVLYTKD
jgi:8-oxo-dGTP pyrophosphatase MutT (NUDIX family)